MKMPADAANVADRKVLVARRQFEMGKKDSNPTVCFDGTSRAEVLKKIGEDVTHKQGKINDNKDELENKPTATQIWEQENESQEDFVQLLIEKAVRLAEEHAFMRKQIIKLREETRKEDNDHKDLDDKEREELFEIFWEELEKKHEMKSDPSSDTVVDLLSTETRPSSPPPKDIPTRHPDDELLLAESDDENYSGTDGSLDVRESL